MVNKEHTSHPVYDRNCQEIQLYESLLTELHQNHILERLEIVELDYTIHSNHKNDFILDSNIYILHNGHVAVLGINTHRGPNLVDCPGTVGLQFVRSSGHVINPLALVEQEPIDNHVRPLCNSELLAIARPDASQLFDTSATFRKLVCQSALQSLSSLEAHIGKRSQAHLKDLLVEYLVYNQENGSLHATQYDLAALLGTDRPNITRVLSHLVSEKIVEIKGKGYIEILDLNRLSLLLP